MPFVEKSKGTLLVFGRGDERPAKWFTKKLLRLFDLMIKSANKNGEDNNSVLWTVHLGHDNNPLHYVIADNYKRYGGLVYIPTDDWSILSGFIWMNDGNIYNLTHSKKIHRKYMENIDYDEAKQLARSFFD